MAIRYCGDIEVRISYVNGKYHAKLRAPGLRAEGVLPPSLHARIRTARDPRRKHNTKTPGPSPEAYDIMALAFLRLAQRQGFPVFKEDGRIALRRTFQAPCPYET